MTVRNPFLVLGSTFLVEVTGLPGAGGLLRLFCLSLPWWRFVTCCRFFIKVRLFPFDRGYVPASP